MLNGVSVTRIDPKNGLWFFQGRKRSLAAKMMWHLRDAWNLEVGGVLKSILAERRPDVVHTHNIDGMSAIVWDVARRAGIPVVHTARDCGLLCPRTTLYRTRGHICTKAPAPCQGYRAWHRMVAQRVNAFCSPSQFMIDLHMNEGFTAGSFHVVRNGIRMESVDSCPPDRVEQRPGRPLRLLYLGQVEPHKGILTILDAFKRLDRDANIELGLAGRGSLESTIVEAADADARILWHGFVNGDSKKSLLRTYDVLLQPSLWYETGAPTVSLMEAFLNGMTIIASNIAGLPEVIEHGVSGLLVPPGDEMALYSAMRSLCDGSVDVSALKRAARKSIDQYSIARTADGYLSIYESLLQSK